jgi:anti-sigma B factor antagonist
MSHTPFVDEPGPVGAGVTLSPAFVVDVTEEAGQVIGHVSGEIDLSSCQRLRDAIEPHLGPRQRIMLDLSGVSFMDSSCLRVLLQTRTALSADGGSLILRNPSRATRRLLSASGMDDLFDAEIG